FDGCTNLESLDLSNWNTQNVQNMTGMFHGCSSLESLDLSNWNTQNAVSMNHMFYSCSKLTELKLSKSFQLDSIQQLRDLPSSENDGKTNYHWVKDDAAEIYNSTDQLIEQHNNLSDDEVHTYTIQRSHEVSFVTNNGDDQLPTQKVLEGKFAQAPNYTGTKDHHQFEGWMLNEQKFDFEQMGITEPTTLSANWRLNQYTIRFNENGGTGTMASQILSYDEKQPLIQNAFERIGYSFKGWSTTENGQDGENFADQAEVKNLSMVDGESIDLYAQWEANQYNVIFDRNGGSGVLNPQQMTYDLATGLSENEFTRKGYSFTGWNTQADGTGTSYLDKEEVNNLVAEPNGSITLFAQWDMTKYNVTFDSAGGSTVPEQSYTMETGLTDFATPTRNGFMFLGWYDGETKVEAIEAGETGDRTLTAKWEIIEYTITFDDDLIQPITYTIESDALKLPTKERIGYTFLGWLVSEDTIQRAGTEPGETVQEIQSGTTGNLRLSAQWEANQYSINFDSNGGSGELAPQQLTYDLAVTLSENKFTRPGYSFIGWNSQVDGTGTAYSDKQEVENLVTESNGSITLFAQWEANKSALEDLVNEEKQNPRDKEDYTAESWKNYEEALAQAKKVLADDQATAEQIATALEELKTAIANLELLKTSDGQIIGTANDSTTTRKSYPSAGTQAKSFPQTGMIAGSGMMIAGIAVVGAALAGWKKRKKK
ncbi:InlB B-repeat-containing protein, partial [Enterococcus pingfangensis]